MQHNDAVARHSERVWAEFLRIADDLAAELSITPLVAITGLKQAMLTKLKGTAADIDGRRSRWRARIRLYRADLEEPQADSDPDSPPDARGVAVLLGLPGVAEWLEHLAAGYHGAMSRQRATVTGLDQLTLTHSLKSLRPTVSRRGGNGTWRVHYQVDSVAWIARVDVERV